MLSYDSLIAQKSYTMKKVILYILLCLVTVTSLWATHNRAGEITYVHDPLPGQPHRFTFEIVTYTKESSTDADRDSLTIFWGNNDDSSVLPRTNNNGNGESVENRDDIKKNIYRGSYSYPGASTYYVVSMADPNRNEDIININNGNSVDVQFFIEDTLFLINPQFYGYNNSPFLFQPPVDNGQVGEVFKHNPNAFDIDGDSLVFELAVPLQSANSPVPNYEYPDEIGPGSDNTISLDPNTGEFTWDSPQETGEYNVAFLIREYRNGIQIGTMVRDMQILIEDVDNTSPELSFVQDTCMVPGQTLTVNIEASESEDAPTSQQIIELSAFGGPFELEENPAIFFTQTSGINTATGSFTWNIVCEHIYSDEYIVVFKAEDNFALPNNDPLPLSDLLTWLISVVPPPIENLTSEAQAGKIILTWGEDDSYLCSDSDKFLGFSVWRKAACDTTSFAVCDNDLAADGYTLLAEDISEYTYTDETAQPGINYVYRITARFADVVTENNDPLNFSQSAPSEGICESLPRDLPTLLNVSVENTDTNDGEIYVRWAKPNPVDLDTLINQPPYTYELMRSEGNAGNFETIASFTAANFAQANDTVFNDTGLNTSENPYFYKIRFITGDFTLGDTPVASSVFINTTPSDNQVQLTWNEQVPWLNESYTIFRKAPSETVFEELTTTSNQTFTDTNLTNGSEYCYYIESSGTYNAEDLPAPLINLSQERCDVPIDTTPPCAPSLTVTNDCDQEETGELLTYDTNLLSWTLEDAECVEDAETFNILYQAPSDTNFVIIHQRNFEGARSYLHEVEESLAGCYAVTAIDSFNNESLYSNIVCTESCLTYELPNTFTPNADNMNDVFTPLEGYRFVNKIDLNIFTNWGNLVFATNNPAINWDGKEQNTEKDLPSGTYYYTCKVFEVNSDGSERIAEELSGYIHLFRE